MDKLLVVDGHSLFWQMYCGMPSRIVNKNGKAIQGTMGFIGALIKIIKLSEPTHIIVLFDGEHEIFRTELSTEYKANRDKGEPEDDMFLQLQDIKMALDTMGIRHTEVIELVEADDVIASYVSKYKKDMKIIISSFDSDFFQLVDEHVTILRYRGVKTIICDIKYIKDKFNILPEQYAGFKSLTGDTSDNIRGAEKVGIITAAELMNQFTDLHTILTSVEKIEKPAIRESITRNKERLKMNYKLVKLDDRAMIPFEINELPYVYNGVTTHEVLKRIKLFP